MNNTSRYMALILSGILLAMLAANFLELNPRYVSLAAAAVVALITFRTDFASGLFMGLLYCFAYYSIHPAESIPAFLTNTGVFAAVAFLASRAAAAGKHGKKEERDEPEKEFVRKVTNSLMLAHEMMCEIKRGTPHNELLELMSKNIFSLLNVRQVLVYSAAEGNEYRLLMSSGDFEKSTVKEQAVFSDMERLAVTNINAAALNLIRGAGAGFYLIVPSGGEGGAGKDAVVLFREKEFDNSEIYITEFFIAQVYAVIEKYRYSDSLKDSYEKVIETLSLAIDAKDQDKRWHSLDTMRYAAKMADKLGMPAGEKEKIRYASLLHDIGKINISSGLLNKPGKLTAEEYETIKTHPGEGADILKRLDLFAGIMPIILHHHEHIDGKGYPESLKGDDIPLGSRICAIADAYSVMITDRPYRAAMTKEEAIAELKRCAGTQFDPKLTDLFIEIVNAEK